MGDSLSSGEFESTDPETGSKTYHNTFEYSWGQFLARMVGSYIDYIIRHNMNDFKQVGFIGTPFRNTKDGGAFLPDGNKIQKKT